MAYIIPGNIEQLVHTIDQAFRRTSRSKEIYSHKNLMEQRRKCFISVREFPQIVILVQNSGYEPNFSFFFFNTSSINTLSVQSFRFGGKLGLITQNCVPDST